MKKENQHSDIVIIGAGLIGLSMALILAAYKINVRIIEQSVLKKKDSINTDSRTTAISQGTKRFLDSLGLWQYLEKNVQPIKKIEVTDTFMSSNLVFDSNQLDEGFLGYIIDNAFFKNFLINKVRENRYIKIIDGNEVSDIKFHSLDSDKKLEIIIKREKITCNLVIAADGRNSKARSYAGFKTYNHRYNQNAYIFNVEHELNHNGVALEKFFPEGPLAILPMRKSNNAFQSSVVWTIDDELGDFTDISKEFFKTEFLLRYDNYLGKVIKISNPKRYPLNLVYSRECFKDKIVLIGDASQAIHPIAGQGFNLGIRDCQSLAKTILNANEKKLNFGSREVLLEYSKRRNLDQKLFINSTHFLNKIFSNNYKTIRFFRNNGLRIVQRLPKIKKQLMSTAMGLKRWSLTDQFQ